MSQDNLVAMSGVLALDINPRQHLSRLSLERDEAEHLAGLMADDLRIALPGIAQARLAMVGAHFDSSELLRPGLECFAALQRLASGTQGEVVAFGCRDGHMPATVLVPDPALVGGELRLVPWTLLADPALIATLGPDIERELVGEGEASPTTADYVIRTLGMELQHARLFSLRDLMALVDVHYEHMNLTGLWEMIEPALLGSRQEETAMSAHGLAWHFSDGRALAQSPGQWLVAQKPADADARAHALAGIIFELRQYTTMLAAHHVPFGFDAGHFDTVTQCLIESDDTAADPALGTPELYAHEAPGLGVIGLTVAQPAGGDVRILAQAWPLAPRLKPVCSALAERFGCSATPQRLGKIVLDDRGLPSAPIPTMH